MPKPKLSGLLAQIPRSFCLACACGLLSAAVATAPAESFTFTTLAGTNCSGAPISVDGTNGNARFTPPAGAALDSGTNLYVTETYVIRRAAPVGTNWVVTTLAGQTNAHGHADGTNDQAQFNDPQGVAVDGVGRLYVADTLNAEIRKVIPVGTNWVVSTLAGFADLHGGVIGSADGTNSNARFNHPYGVGADTGGTVYVADTYNHTIRRVAPAGTNWVVSTLAGLAGISGNADGTNNSARFNSPTSVAVDSASNLYVADYGNNTIRKISQAGTNWVVSTLAGLPGVSGNADGVNTNTRFNGPLGIAADAAGKLYVTDSGNNTIRKLRPVGTNWVVSTLAGTNYLGDPTSVDGTGNRARFNNPNGIAVNGAGNLFVGDTLNCTVRGGQLAILLQISRAASQVSLSWPVAATGFVLEARSTLPGAGPWLRLTNGVTTSDDNFVFTTNASGASFFYRLHKP